MGVEGGVVGLFVLCALLLAMFSKELSNQALLWIGLAFYGIKKAD